MDHHKPSYGYIINLLIAVGIFIVLFSKIDFAKTFSVLTQVDLRLFSFAIMLSIFANIILASEEWRVLLKGLGCPISFSESVFIKLALAPVKGILPVKSGELLRPIYLKKLHNFPLSFGIFSIFISLTLSLFVLLGLILIGCLFYKVNPYILGYISLFFIILTLLIVKSLKSLGSKGTVFNFIQKFPFNFYKRIEKIASLFKILNYKKLILPLFYAAIGGIIEVIIFYILFRGINVVIPMRQIIIFVPLVLIISNFPIALFGLGAREAIIILFFVGYVSPEELLSGGLLFSFVDYFLSILIGIFFTRTFLNKIWSGV